MFGNLYFRYQRGDFIRKGRSAAHAQRKLGRFRSYRYLGRYRGRRTRNIRSANRAITQVHRIGQYNGGSGDYAIDLVTGNLNKFRNQTALISQIADNAERSRGNDRPGGQSATCESPETANSPGTLQRKGSVSGARRGPPLPAFGVA